MVLNRGDLSPSQETLSDVWRHAGSSQLWGCPTSTLRVEADGQGGPLPHDRDDRAQSSECRVLAIALAQKQEGWLEEDADSPF